MTGRRARIIPEPVGRREGPQVAPRRARKRPGKRCVQCGAVGTHYLTCASLRLPPDYRLGADLGPERLRGLPAGNYASSAGPAVVCDHQPGRPGSGPDHPDWPHPPQR
jgi:hypothetical protein